MRRDGKPLHPNSNVTARCHGHKVVAICDLAPTLPIVWTNVSTSMGERDACRQLLRTLNELWPECPMHTLVGDSLYDQDEAFAMKLEFDWDLHPVFPRGGKVSKALPHVENEGVPSCPHGLMPRDRHDDFPTATWRRQTVSRWASAPARTTLASAGTAPTRFPAAPT